jgi:hypothetical protein
MGALHDDPARMAAGVRQTVGRLILDLDLMLADGQDPAVRRDALVHMIIELAGHLCRTEGFRETALLYAVVAEAAHAHRPLSPDDMPQILRSWHERLRAEGRPAPQPTRVPPIPPPAETIRTGARPRHASGGAKPHKPKVGLFGRELARHKR